MKLGRRPTLAIMAALMLFNVLLRYPRSEHEVDVDSFFIHALSGAILSDGYAEWVLNPLSFFGWYPLSYPSAGPFSLACISAVSGMNLEAAILALSMLLGPVGILGTFLVAREIRQDNRFALAAAYLYGLAPRFLAITLWTGSTRNLFMALLPITLWALLRTYRRRSVGNLAVLAICFMTLAASHRLIVLIFIVIIAFLFAIMVQVVLRIVRIRIPQIVLRNSVRGAAPQLALAFVVLSAIVMLIGMDVLAQYSTGEIASGSDVGTQLLNLTISIARSGGLALAFSLIGLVVVTRHRNKTIAEPFLAMTLVGLIPTLFLRQYTGFYIMPFLAIFGGLGLVDLIRRFNHHHVAAAVVGISLVLGVAVTSTLILEVEVSRVPVLPSYTYSTGVYVRTIRLPGTMVANDGLTGIRVAAVSGVSVLPIGGAGTTFQNPELLAYRFYSGHEVANQLVRLPIQDLSIESDSLWIVTGIQAELDWVEIVSSPYGNVPNTLMARYQPSYYLELDQASGRFLAFSNTYCSNLGLGVGEQAYRIYSNGYESLWWLHSPGWTSSSEDGPRRCP